MSIIKKGIDKSLELSKNTLDKITNVIQDNDVVPYSISVSKGKDITELKPHYLKVEIDINDKLFKKRIANILKEYRYRLCYEWYEENVGTFFKPKHEQQLKMMINAYPSKSEATTINIVVGLLTFGAFDDTIDYSNTYKLKDLNNLTISFETERECNLFAQQLEEILNDFYRSHYKEYSSLKTEAE